MALRERQIADGIRRSRSNNKRIGSPSPRPERFDRSQSPSQQASPPQSDWNVLTDTLEEPSDVDFELPITLEENHLETLKSENSTRQSMTPSLENSVSAPLVFCIMIFLLETQLEIYISHQFTSLFCDTDFSISE